MSDKLYLKPANMEDAAEEYGLLASMPPDENGFTNPYAGCSFEEFNTEILPKLISYSKGIDLPDGFVPQTTYFLWDGDTVVGLFRLRHYLNDFLREYHGHIGYGIRREYRGRGYAAAGLQLLIDIAWDVIAEDEIYLSVHKDNPASLQVQVKNGARIVREDDECYYTRISRWSN